MAERPINFKDLVDLNDIYQSIDAIAARLQKETAKAIADGVREASKIKSSVQGANIATPQGQKAVKDAAAGVAKLTAEQKKLLETQTRLNAIRAAYRKEIKQSIALEGAEEGSILRLRKTLSDLTAQYNRAGAAQRKDLQPAIKKTSDELKRLERAIGDNRRNVGNYESGWKKAGKTLLASAGLIGGVTMALRGVFRVIKGGFKTTFDFEKAMSGVKAISGATKTEFTALRNSAIALGGSTAFTASEVASLQTEYAKLGFTTSQILEITEATLDLAAATGEDLARSASIAGATLRGFGLAAYEMQRVVDVMAKSFSSSALDLAKFETAMQNVAPVANATGDSIEQATAKLSVLADAGLDASTSGTSLRNMYLELEKRGLSWDQAMLKIQGSQNKASTSLDLFGKRGAVAGIILSENQEKAAALAISYEDAAGSAEQMAETKLDNVRGELTRLSSAWEGLNLRTLESTGLLRGFLAAITDIVTAINTKGKFAIDSIFETEKIDGFRDRLRFFTKQGVGFSAAVTAAMTHSNEAVQEMNDELAKINSQRRKDEEESAKATADAEEKKRKENDATIAAQEAAVAAEEAQREAAAKAIQDHEAKVMAYRAKLSADRERFLDAEGRNAVERMLKTGEGQLAAQVQTDQLITDQYQKHESDLTAIAAQEAELRKEIDREITREKIENALMVAQQVIQIAGTQFARLENLIEKQKQVELSAAGDNAKKREEIEKKYAKKQKNMAIAGALLDAAGAIVRQFSDLPFPAALVTSAIVAGITAAEISTMNAQKFAHGGSGMLGSDREGVLSGRLHSQGGVNLGAIGEAERGEYFGIINRRQTARYGATELSNIFDALNSGRFHDVFGRTGEKLNVSVAMAHQDPYTKKLYEMYKGVPIQSYTDSNGATVLVYEGGEKIVLNG